MCCKYCYNCDIWDLDSGKLISVEDLMKEVVIYKYFMKVIGGGVIVFGGEVVL